jgi:hypothetical protein
MMNNWTGRTAEQRARMVEGMFTMAARGQAIRASRELDRAVAEGGDVEAAVEQAKVALRAVLTEVA